MVKGGENRMSKRSLIELSVLAESVFQLPSPLRGVVLELARTKSPSGTFQFVQKAVADTGLEAVHPIETEKIAKAARWLAVLRRDYGEEAFVEFVESRDTVSTDKEGGT